MVQSYNKNLRTLARELRKKMTDAEILLWSRLRRKAVKGVQFYRQKVLGDYIVDFYCPSAKLIVEVDGGQHFMDAVIETDRARYAFLNGRGFKVLRFSNMEVLDSLHEVLDVIHDNV